MNKIYRFIFFLPILILGCTPNVIEKNEITKKINSLDLNFYSNSGDKKYSITSPYSIYDTIQDKFQFKKTTINIFHDGKSKYIINSDESTLSDNNKIVELTGNVKLKTLNQDEDYLYADKFIWNIDENNYLLIGNIRFENKNVILVITPVPSSIFQVFRSTRFCFLTILQPFSDFHSAHFLVV